jgi:hypothetical protein
MPAESPFPPPNDSERKAMRMLEQWRGHFFADGCVPFNFPRTPGKLTRTSMMMRLEVQDLSRMRPERTYIEGVPFDTEEWAPGTIARVDEFRVTRIALEDFISRTHFSYLGMVLQPKIRGSEPFIAAFKAYPMLNPAEVDVEYGKPEYAIDYGKNTLHTYPSRFTVGDVWHGDKELAQTMFRTSQIHILNNNAASGRVIFGTPGQGSSPFRW